MAGPPSRSPAPRSKSPPPAPRIHTSLNGTKIAQWQGGPKARQLIAQQGGGVRDPAVAGAAGVFGRGASFERRPGSTTLHEPSPTERHPIALLSPNYLERASSSRHSRLPFRSAPVNCNLGVTANHRRIQHARQAIPRNLAQEKRPPNGRLHAAHDNPNKSISSPHPPMHSILTLPVADSVVIAFGSLFLFFSTFLTHPRPFTPWTFAEWVKVAFRMIGPLGIVYSVLRVYQVFRGHILSVHANHFLTTTRLFILGVLFGLLSLFILSGEWLRGYRRWRELRRKVKPLN
jgi:hypothetical protein